MKTFKQLGILALALVASIIEIVKAPFLSSALPIPDEAKMALTLGTSMLLLITGAFYVIIDIANSVKEDVEKLKSSVADKTGPNGTHPTCCDGVRALSSLTERLKISKLALNTRFTPKEFTLIYHSEIGSWNAEIVKCVKRGLEFREVVANSGVFESKKVISELKKLKNINGIYEPMELRLDFNTCMNFIVLHLTDGTKEVWFGWILTKGKKLEANCFRSSDSALVGMFEEWHSALMTNGSPISV